MNLENWKEAFPQMPEEMRAMVEREVARQLDMDGSERAEKKGGRSAGKTSCRKLAVFGLAATMVLGLTAAAGTKVYQIYNEQVADYAVKTGVKTEGTSTYAIPDVDIRIGYLPEGLFQCDVCGETKYHFEDTVQNDPHAGGVSLMEWVMDTEGDLEGIIEKSVVERRKMTIGGHDAVYLQKQKIDSGCIGYNRIIYIMYPEVQRILQIYVGDDMPEDDMMKMAESIELVPNGQVLQEGDYYSWNDYAGDQQTETENYDFKAMADREEMANLHAVGEEIAVPLYADTPEEEFVPTEDIRIKVTDVQVADDLSLLEDSEYVEERWKNAVGPDGKLSPDTVQYMKKGDGIETLDEVVRTEEKAQKLVYVTLEYTNTGAEELKNILFFHSMMAIAKQGDEFILYDQMRRQEDGDWDEMVNTGVASLGEMYYYDVRGGERQNNYISSLKPGETVTVHIANIVHEDELPYLYLNLLGTGYEFSEKDLEVGYVDIRQ